MSKYIKLNNCIDEYIAGDWGKEEISDNYTQKVLCVRGTDLNDLNSSNIDKIPVRYILSKNRDKILNNGNIIIEISGGSPKQSTGRIGYIDNITEDIICSNFCKALKIKDNFYPKFIFYALKNIYNSNIFFNFESKTTGIKNLLIDVAFDCIKIKNYNFFDQKAIANILSALDQKIALNNQINAQLEQMAKTLYDYWFVQFDFPDENGKPYKSSGGEMVYNDTLKREIPKGWEAQKISHWLQSDKSGDWGKEIQEGNYTLQVNCIRGADINAVNFQGNIEAPIRFILPKNKHKLLSPFNLVVEISGGSPTQSTGRLALISDYVLNRFDFPVICSNFCKAISLKNTDYFYQFVFMWNAIYKNDILFDWEGKTSGIKNLLFENFTEGYYECYPPLDLAKKFFEIADVFHKQQQFLLKQNQQLAQLRDFLLPMLMNGQVGVGDD